MCERSEPASSADALSTAGVGLRWLAAADAAALTTAEQADCLRALERLESQLTAARARVLTAFSAASGYETDAAVGCKSWLRWQARVTAGAAAGAVGWMRRLSAHPAVAGALAAASISVSWARLICEWVDKLPEAARAEAEEILLGAAVSGAELDDLAVLAAKIHSRVAPPDTDAGDGFQDRNLTLDVHWRGAGRLVGDLTPDTAEAVQAVLDALGKRAGPEDLRSPGQRRHDALAEACRRLIAAGCLPDRAGQPTQIQLHMTLDQLLGLPGADGVAGQWSGPGAAMPPGADCDASMVPVVTGNIDPEVLDQAADMMLGKAPAVDTGDGSPAAVDGSAAGGRFDTEAMAMRAAREVVIAQAVRLLSGPDGLAGWMRVRLLVGQAASASLPLDVGAATETIPPHIRRAIGRRDKHCRFPGCHQPVAACQVHHLIPRSKDGATSVTNCLLLCAFHHLIAIHRWGWQLRLNPDGTTTATSPYGGKTLHSQDPPGQAA